MKLPLLFLMIFSASLNAQLYIGPSPKTDTYIYARDRLIYVEKDLHLNENHKKETEASIYLRKGAQLLQGNKLTNNNRGSGKISVFQTGTSNAYDYNYWAMPVVINDKNIQVNDYLYEPLSKTESREAKLISALDGSSDPLSISSRWIYAFSGINYSNWQFAGDHFDLLPGEGFTMKGVNGNNLNEIEGRPVNAGSAQIYDFRGIPNDGQIKLSIRQEQVLLIGNPYPSALNLDKFLTENTNTTGIAYFWDSRKDGNSHYLSDYEGGYGTYSPGTGIYIPPAFIKQGDGMATGESGSVYNRKMIPIGQGFMVIGKKDGEVIFQNSHRQFQKEEPGISQFKSHISENPSFNLNIEIDGSYIQKLALVFSDESSPEEDHAMDAKKMNEDLQDISWSINSEAFVINVRPYLNKELIPLRLILNKDSELKFSINEMINFNPDRMFIYDAVDDLYFGIKTGYLKIDLPAGEYPDRFFFSFIENVPGEAVQGGSADTEALKPKNILLNSIDIFQNNLQQQLEVKMLYDSDFREIGLFNLNGKQVFYKNFNSKEKEFNYHTGNLSNAVYIVKVKTSDNRELTKKIGIRN
jgi:hypothetical protein